MHHHLALVVQVGAQSVPWFQLIALVLNLVLFVRRAHVLVRHESLRPNLVLVHLLRLYYFGNSQLLEAFVVILAIAELLVDDPIVDSGKQISLPSFV